MKDYQIVPARRKYCAGHAEVLSSVAQEGKYLSTNKPFPEETVVQFYIYCKRNEFPQFVVLNDSERVVGWCDVVTREGYPENIGFIGVGLLPEYRGRGIGTELMLETMKKAKQAGFNEIRLDCRATNKTALHLYKKLGFRRLITLRKGLVIDGENIPLVCMKKRI